MIPMGWNQIRQTRVSGMNQQQQHMPYAPIVPNQQQFNMYRPPTPAMIPPQPPHIYPTHHMMGNYGMPNPQVGLRFFLFDSISVY